MLFPYKYVPHSMEIMQVYIDYIFYEVWCQAKNNEYDIEILFADNVELLQMITELHTSDLKGADFFLTGLQSVFQDFEILTDDQIEQLKHWYLSNNSINLLCANDPSVTPATYQTISTISPDLSAHLKAFFKNLYSHSFLSLKSVAGRIGSVDDHYLQAFLAENKSGKCPFCGILDIKGCYHSKREAYDHYLPKSIYPFNSINFSNLAPACHECNSTYKLTNDPAYTARDPALANAGERRKAFFPYADIEYKIEPTLEVQTDDWTLLKPEDIKCSFGPEELKEQIDTWLDVYGIKERYKAKCCGENDGMFWIEQVLDEWKEDGKTPEEFLHTLSRQANKKPYADSNFLKKAFLEGCQRAGLFSD